ncbi:MAG: nuclear transport factor 2 family protein [Acidimicrobiia bacterium]|nr:nuclear transport factor 2 family protein [Acidimicrobiia bacterium]MBT8217638.1 nuclear transport factor 2 family protein [Acidimicrobiia bacterium]NNF09667.1 nuclear transport factor 2 family protein [Acidimicrobiia bacterium]NNL68764.1 nuclear transport factor 2 family protein [Acidimicrobiia bacterium]
MTEVELRKLDDEMVDAYMAHDIDLILSHCSDEVRMVDYGAEPVMGKQAARDYLAEQFAVFSDDKYTHTMRIFGDNAVFGELEWTAAHTGDMPLPDGSTFPATGKTIHARVAYAARLDDDGQVIELKGYPDLADIMGQLGMMG